MGDGITKFLTNKMSKDDERFLYNNKNGISGGLLPSAVRNYLSQKGLYWLKCEEDVISGVLERILIHMRNNKIREYNKPDYFRHVIVKKFIPKVTSQLLGVNRFVTDDKLGEKDN